MTFFFCYQLHTNFWYAEYTHEQAIRQFSRTFEDLLTVFENHKASACWDWETSITLQMLKDSSVDFLPRLNKLVDQGLHDVIPCTWQNTLGTHHTLEEFNLNWSLTNESIRKYFNRISPTWVSQDGAWTPQFLPYMEKEGMEYVLLDQRLLNRFYKGKYPKEQRFQSCFIEGTYSSNIPKNGINNSDLTDNGDDNDISKLPCLIFGLEGINSASNHPEAYQKRIDDISKNNTNDNRDFLIYPFIDTERISPKLLDTWLTKIENINGEYITPSKFLQKNPPNKNSPTFHFDICDWHDPSFHNDVYIDQKLFTLVERARAKLRESQWWMSQFKILISNSEDSDNKTKYQDQKLIVRFQTDIDDAIKSIISAQSSDKTHWYACQHKIDVGQKFAVAAYEKLSYICGVLPRICARYSNKFPSRPHVMKEPSLSLSLVNNTNIPYPKGFPVSLDFPYIVVVNLSTKPSYEIESQIGKKLHTTIFNIIPGLDIHNYRTELFYSLPNELKSDEVFPIKLLPSNDELDWDDNEDNLENSIIKVKINPEDGSLESIIDKKSGKEFRGPDQKSLLNTRFETHIPGHGDQGLEVIDIDSDSENSIVVERTSINKKLHQTIKYRVFPEFPGILIDSYSAVAGPMPGILCPFKLQWDQKVSGVLRECLDENIYSDKLIPEIFINDWAILHSKNYESGIAVAIESNIHSCKQLIHQESNSWEFGFMRHFPQWVAQHLLGGIYHQRMWLIPYKNRGKIPEDVINLTKQLCHPPIVSWYL